MITKFNAGNISPFCEGFLNNIYDGAQRMIEDRLNHPEHGEMDARFVKEAVESSWAAEMSSQYAPLLLSMLSRDRFLLSRSKTFTSPRSASCLRSSASSGRTSLPPLYKW